MRIANRSIGWIMTGLCAQKCKGTFGEKDEIPPWAILIGWWLISAV
jgi:hypothetical protein